MSPHLDARHAAAAEELVEAGSGGGERFGHEGKIMHFCPRASVALTTGPSFRLMPA